MDRKHLKIFISNVERILVEKGLTKKFLADKLGVKPSVISGILDENGNPKLETMVAVANAIGVPIHQLLMDQSNPLIDRINALTEEIRQIEIGKSEKRIELDICLATYEEIFTEEGRKKLERGSRGKWTKSQIESLAAEYKGQIENIQDSIDELEMKQKVIPLEIKRLEEMLGNHSCLTLSELPHKKNGTGK